MRSALAFLLLVLLATPGLALEQPLAAYWHPKDLRGWTPERDPWFAFNQDLQPRIPRIKSSSSARLLPLFPQQTSGHPTTLNQKTFPHIQQYWSQADTVVYFGGSASEGLILAPPPGWIRSAHRNGSKILGSVFFPPNAYGGQAVWVDDFLNDATLDGLIAVAKSYGFDGYFINQETAASSVPQAGSRMLAALQKLKAAGLEISWYDAMLMSGSVSWQRNLNSNNKPFFDASASIFLDFGGTSYKASATLAGDRARSVYQGINVYNGYNATQMKAMIDGGLSIGTYATDAISTDAQQSSFYLRTVNALIPPQALDLGHSLATNFNAGKGEKYFSEGVEHALFLGAGAWRDLRQQNYLPDQTPAAGVTQTFDTTRAFEGGSSLLVISDRPVTTPLFRHRIQIDDGFLKITYQSPQAFRLDLLGSERSSLDFPASDTWKTQMVPINARTVEGIDLTLSGTGQVRLGYLEISSSAATASETIQVSREQNKISIQENPYRLYSEIWAEDKLVEWVGTSAGFISDSALASKGLRVRHVCRQNVLCSGGEMP